MFSLVFLSSEHFLLGVRALDDFLLVFGSFWFVALALVFFKMKTRLLRPETPTLASFEWESMCFVFLALLFWRFFRGFVGFVFFNGNL